LDEATSSLQKAIRRSHTDDACYWAAEMLPRFFHHVWRRLKVILSEDVGIAWLEGPAVIRALGRLRASRAIGAPMARWQDGDSRRPLVAATTSP